MVERGACWEAEHHKMAEEEEGDNEEGREPEMDGTCDACEPDEAQPATHVCPACRFAFCPPHADTHTLSTRHQTIPYHPEPTTAAAAAGARPKGRPTAESLQGAPNGDVCHPGGCPSGGAVGLDEGQERMEAAEQGAPSGAVGGAEGCRNGGVEEAGGAWSGCAAGSMTRRGRSTANWTSGSSACSAPCRGTTASMRSSRCARPTTGRRAGRALTWWAALRRWQRRSRTGGQARI